MKIRVRDVPYERAMARMRPTHQPPRVPSRFFRFLLRTLSQAEVKACNVQFRRRGMEALDREPCLILMNHSCFLDLKIASVLFADRPFQIVCTSDGFVGKEWLMRRLGCIPTQKFISDLTLVRDIHHALKKNACSVLLFPEASYSFDGTATPLPESVGTLVKMLQVPVVTVMTQGAFSHDPLYNGLQLRKVDVSADVRYFLSPEECRTLSAGEINQRLSDAFSFDHFAWQREKNVSIDAPFRADGLHRVLYKCPHCQAEGRMLGKGTELSCTVCGAHGQMDHLGVLQGEAFPFSHVPDWYRWQRACVRKEIEEGTYCLEADVDICLLTDYKAIYRVGEGHLVHNCEGFTLTGCGGKLQYSQSPLSSYSLYSDFFWYEIGDVIAIGTKDCQYYCFPRNCGDIVTKARLAAEELYKVTKACRAQGKSST